MLIPAGEVSQLLERIQDGDTSAETRLFDLLYTDLRRMAAHELRRERSGHSLQPTALVNEAYVRIFRQHVMEATSRAHFVRLAARAMRRLLVDHARVKYAEKRGGRKIDVSLDGVLVYDP